MKEEKTVETSYNDIPYMSKSFFFTSPEKQKTVLQLLGYVTPELKKARVLEIGCSFGGNIIPFAIAHPDAEVIGIDLSEIQIKEGNNIIKYLGLENIQLHHKNIMNFEEDYGKFDYIICHGVFSWVTDEVQNKILEVIKNHLSENGSAIISYNTYPGWKHIDILRDIMKFRIDTLQNIGKKVDPYEQVSYGKGAIEFLEKYAILSEHTKRMITDIQSKDDYYIIHEYFEETNRPMYLYDFNKKLLEYGLFHVIDSDLSRSFPIHENLEIERAINNESANNHVVREQYWDYIFDRQFRISIITHLENKEKCNLTPMLQIGDIQNLHIRALFLKNSEGKYERNGNIFLDELNDVLDELNQRFPNTISIKDLFDCLKDKIKDKMEEKDFYQRIIRLIHSHQVEVFSREIKVSQHKKLKLNDRYINYIRYIMDVQNPVISFANSVGLITEASKIELLVMLLFNGERTDEEIMDIVKENIKNGAFTITKENTTKTEYTEEHFIRDFVKNIRNFIEVNVMNS
ncbi:methyltransferase domain-containing protein [Fusobacterium necrophorum]|uniref:Methyltransferase n=1 Tax=Fusobacterium necrophorum BL TaxID=1441732 RepID=A0AB73BX31_9FUSO|nr:class I SAM-dependent methyltransferase [Fusobacterium necrophorum]AYZ72645.1 methyltransferase domain-containing protein [Fusobacterium necrophorum]AZW09359.1 methyltransferase domain-containing protein [Fusobacterium necrophorum subsp. necrophorum]KDE60795.1 methyltransferase [Fusobacterium necrophorum BFTR-1]KDE63556.1 methyltransferase [Fusobacterium necrophorum BL]KDE68976.1 methyltransferase [Fusobacterium necrophorum DAB]